MMNRFPENLDISLTDAESHFGESLAIAAASSKDVNGLSLPHIFDLKFVKVYTKAVLEELTKNGYEITRKGIKL